jgi:hypothetical protein
VHDAIRYLEGVGDDVGELLTANARVSNTGEKYDEST